LRTEQLTFTRFLAATLVVVYHYGQQIPPFNLPALQPIVQKFNTSVSYFFVLSGFIMSYVYYSPATKLSWSRYLTLRLARVYPLYLLALLLYLCFTIHPFDPVSVAYSAVMLQSWTEHHSLAINYPGWSISVEIFFYVMFPVLLSAYRKISLKTLIAIGVALYVFGMVCLYLIIHQVPEVAGTNLFIYSPPMHLLQFILGNIAGIYVLSVEKTTKGRNLDVPVIALAFALSLILLYVDALPIYHGGLALIFVPLFFYLTANTGVITKLFARPECVFLGEISYGMYILQAPLYYAFLRLNTFLKWGETFFFYSYLIGLILISALLYRVFEVPVRRMIRRLTAE
jgi:peptidoglycan/LPS O-acetylase OafA/YrhL